MKKIYIEFIWDASDYIKDVKMFAINQAKFEAAQTFCESRGWDFTIMTERELQPWKKLNG